EFLSALKARSAPLRSGALAPFGAPRRRFLAGGRSVTGHGAGVGGSPGPLGSWLRDTNRPRKGDNETQRKPGRCPRFHCILAQKSISVPNGRQRSKTAARGYLSLPTGLGHADTLVDHRRGRATQAAAERPGRPF